MSEKEIQNLDNELNFKVFDLYDISEVVVEDIGLKNVINLNSRLVLKSQGKETGRFSKTKVNLIERLIDKIAVAGHRGKKHKIEKGGSTGKFSKNTMIVFNALKLIEEKTKQNPVKVLVKAIENSAPRDEVTNIEYGGAKYPQAVEVSPMRRINLALKHISHGASDKAFKKKKSFTNALAEEIIMAYNENGESFAIKKKNDSEKQADSAR
ncbi:MAG: 30S ribosomal protein S7 [Nanoarchaeota archaeon]